MGDPELRSDEKVLVRTPGVYVKSIPFEGILTNKRIILVDRAKNLLPPKEIPLVTIKEVESGENAIRDQIITLSVMAKTGETRQMILTFSRQAGGNRIKERDAWARIIKENASSSFDQVIRKVIPGSEPAPRRTEPAAAQRYEVVRSPLQQTAPSGDNRPTGTETDGMSPVRGTGVISPAPTVPPSPAVRQMDASTLGMSVFCPKCGNKVPSESVFCNRCGSPIVRTPPVSAPVQPPAAPPVVKPYSARPIDEEIQSIEPLIERTTAKIPSDALRTAPVEPPLRRQSLSWDDEEEPATPFEPDAQVPAEKPSGRGFFPQIFSAKSTTASVPAPDTSYGTPAGDTPPPPKPPKRRSLMPGKETLLTVAVALVAILLIAAGALFVYPMLTGGGLTPPPGGDVTPASTSSAVLKTGTIVIRETLAPVIPATGVYVHVNYLGGFKGSYGMPEFINNVPGNSGDRIWEVENVSGTVRAEFEKLDGSDAVEVVRAMISTQPKRAVDLRELNALFGMPEMELKDICSSLAKAGQLVLIPVPTPVYMRPKTVQEIEHETLALVTRFHAQNPLQKGVSREELRKRIFDDLPAEVFRFLLDRMAERKSISVQEESVCIYGREVQLSPRESALREKIEGFYREVGSQPPSLSEVPGAINENADEVRRIFFWMTKQRILIKVSEDLAWHSLVLDEIKGKIRSCFKPGDKFGVAEFKQLFGMTRKHAIPLLEYLDRERVTRRQGNDRVLL